MHTRVGGSNLGMIRKADGLHRTGDTSKLDGSGEMCVCQQTSRYARRQNTERRQGNDGMRMVVGGSVNGGVGGMYTIAAAPSVSFLPPLQ